MVGIFLKVESHNDLIPIYRVNMPERQAALFGSSNILGVLTFVNQRVKISPFFGTVKRFLYLAELEA